MPESLDKHGQLAVVIVGFFATVHLLVSQSAVAPTPATRLALSFALVLGLAVRYWWVILLLPWPFHWLRLLLLLAAWSALPFVAASTTDGRQWVRALALVSTVGFATEVFNGLTRQWRVGSDTLTRALRNDHITGAVAAALAAIVLMLAASAFTSPNLERLVFLMLLADWIRLVLMIRRHQRLLAAEQPR